MVDIEVIMWTMGLGFTALGSLTIGVGSLVLYLHGGIMKRIDDLAEEVKDIDRRLCRIEGAMMNKDCCMLKHDHSQKAE